MGGCGGELLGLRLSWECELMGRCAGVGTGWLYTVLSVLSVPSVLCCAVLCCLVLSPPATGCKIC